MNVSKNIVIVGAGIVGLATAYQLARKLSGHKIAIIEKEEHCGTHQSTRNSGVIHSGVYYKPGSYKAKNCTEGRAALLDFCRQNDIPLKRLGKLIVASNEKETPYLEELLQRGISNGLDGLQVVAFEKMKEIEPHVFGVKALWVPNCYSVAFSDVVQALEINLKMQGVDIFKGQKVIKMSEDSKEITIDTSKQTFKASFVINCAGLHSDEIASLILKKEDIPHKIIPFRGEYWEIKPEKAHLVNGLIYPVPNPKFPFLGVHLSRMIDDRVMAGPNAVLALAKEGYKQSTINLKDCMSLSSYPGFWKMALKYWNVGLQEMLRSYSKTKFVKDAQKLIPELEEDDFIPGKSGVRAQVVKRDGTLLDDFSFVLKNKSLHVLNAPSPAATSCLSIGSHLADKVLEVIEK